MIVVKLGDAEPAFLWCRIESVMWAGA